MPKKKTNPKQNGLSRAVSKARPKPKKAPAKSATGTVFQLKITLNDIRPPIWRRLQTKDCTLANLDNIIQVSMGWEGYHLHEFEIEGQQYGEPEQWDQADDWDEPEIMDEHQVKLGQIPVKKFKYLYDM